MPDDDRTGHQRLNAAGAEAVPPRRAYPVVAGGRRSAYGHRTTAGRHGAGAPVTGMDAPRRRLAEFAVPAAVILAGVLVVVAFGFVISRAVRDDDRAIPLPQPPALTAEPAPSDQAVIPLPTPSSSRPSSSPSPRTSAPPDPGHIGIDRATIASPVLLSAEGRRDWVHWGLDSALSLERDEDGGSAILEGTPTAPRLRHTLGPELYRWQDGSPIARTEGTPTGIRTCGQGNGFTLSAPAATSQRTLRLYVGVFAGTGRLEAKLSTGGATRTARLEQRATALRTAVYVITYRAPDNGRITLRWVTEKSFDADCGGVALQAATLR